MNASQQRRLGTEILPWTARVLGTLVVLLFLVFLIGEGPPHPSILTVPEKLMFAATGLMLLGLIMAWRWAGFGGTLALLGYLLFGILAGMRSAIMSPFAAGGVSGILHLAGWWLSHPSPWRQDNGPKRLGVSALALGGGSLIIWLWLGVGARSMEARIHNPPNLTGRWVGTGQVSDSFVDARKLDLDVTILQDGSFRGRVGDADIVNGRVEPHLRGRLGYLQSRMGEPGYAMFLELSRPPVATPRRSLPQAYLYFDIRSGQIVGALHLTDLPEELRDLHLVLQRRDE